MGLLYAFYEDFCKHFSDKYSEKYIEDMGDLLFKNRYMKPVTYAVRASLAANSIPELKYLLETSPAESTLTAWCSDPKDVINYPKLVQLINAVGIDRVYLDLPDDMSKMFFELYAASNAGVGGSKLDANALLLTSLFGLKNVFI